MHPPHTENSAVICGRIKDLLELQTQRAFVLNKRLAEKSVPEEFREELQVKMREIDAELKKGDSDAAEKKNQSSDQTTQSRRLLVPVKPSRTTL